MLAAMNSAAVQRAKAARKFGIGLIVVGLASLAWLIASQFNPVVPAVPSIQSIEALAPSLPRVPWMPQPTVLLFALASLAGIWLGATIAARQKPVLEADRRQTEDRLRRVQQYGGDRRIEPYIGSPISIDEDKEPG